jgi:hypothetical protein
VKGSLGAPHFLRLFVATSSRQGMGFPRIKSLFR